MPLRKKSLSAADDASRGRGGSSNGGSPMPPTQSPTPTSASQQSIPQPTVRYQSPYIAPSSSRSQSAGNVAIPSQPGSRTSPNRPPPETNPQSQSNLAPPTLHPPQRQQPGPNPRQAVLTRSRNPSIRLRRTPSYDAALPAQSRSRGPTLTKSASPSSSPARRPPDSATRQFDPPPAVGASTATGKQVCSPIDEDAEWQSGRRRSSSEPQRPTWALAGVPPPQGEPPLSKAGTRTSYMPPVKEEPSSRQGSYQDQRPGTDGADHLQVPEPPQAGLRKEPGRLRRASVATLSALGKKQAERPSEGVRQPSTSEEYDSRIVDVLDVVDPEISTLSTLTNVQNSLFVPQLGSWLNRAPTYTLTRRTTRPDDAQSVRTAERPPTMQERIDQEETDVAEELAGDLSRQSTAAGGSLAIPERPELRPQESRMTIKSTLSESRYAVLPPNTSLDGWTAADKAELNDHVRHMLHSRREGFKRGMRGFGQYVKRPLGFFVTLYATLITLFGLAWVLFLIGWISVGSKQLYMINVIDYVLVALFAIMGDGLAPFRAVDTYHMIYIAHYHHLTWKLRQKQQLPKLQDHNDLPGEREEDIGFAPGEARQLAEKTNSLERGDAEFSVLSPKQQERLNHHSAKFAKSHTFYKPHETQTHHAFPLRLLVAVVVLLDFHSLFQISLGACTWGIDWRTRPFALTTVILCCSITCNITAGVLISVGDRRTRKKDVIERLFRQELTSDAIEKMQRRRERAELHDSELEDLQPAIDEKLRDSASSSPSPAPPKGTTTFSNHIRTSSSASKGNEKKSRSQSAGLTATATKDFGEKDKDKERDRSRVSQELRRSIDPVLRTEVNREALEREKAREHEEVPSEVKRAASPPVSGEGRMTDQV